MCEISGSLESKEPTEDQCDSRWSYFVGSCYFMVEIKKSYYDAKQDCKNRGASLVSINTKEEFEFLNKTTKFINFWVRPV